MDEKYFLWFFDKKKIINFVFLNKINKSNTKKEMQTQGGLGPEWRCWSNFVAQFLKPALTSDFSRARVFRHPWWNL